MDTQVQTIQIPLGSKSKEDFVLVPVKLFQKLQAEKIKLRDSLREQHELVETLKIIREGEEEYLSGKTTTQSLSALMS